mgnify:CR=1 FL=1
MISISLTLLLSTLIIGTGSDAWACGPCMIASADQILPPIYLWCSIAVGWFLATGAIASFFRVKSKYIPGILKTFLYLFLFFFVGASTGMLGLLVLAVPPALTFAYSFSSGSIHSWPHGFRLGIRWLALVAVTAFSIASIKCIHIRQTRSPFDFILQWGDLVPSLVIIHSWKQKEPEILPNYRFIIEHGKDQPVVFARIAERLAAIGDPAIDIPILEAAFRRCDSWSRPDACRKGINEPMEKLRLRKR